MVCAVCGFLAGSIPFSWLMGRARGVDLRSTGSGNAGATNLFRTCGWKAGTAGFALDSLKGALPVLAAGAVYPGPFGRAVAGLAAVLGHVFTPWLGWRGGKGVATGLGAMIVIAPLPVLSSLVVFVAVLAAWRFVSLASISAALALVPACLLLPCGHVERAVCVVVAALLIARHASNIGRLSKGTERRLGGGTA